MKLKLKEDPGEWRKSAWLAALGLAAGSSLLRWRHVLPAPAWRAILAFLTLWAGAAAVRPGWFRGFYRFTAKFGFNVSKIAGYAALTLFFFLVITPAGLLLRFLGQDPLRMRRQTGVQSYWSEVRRESSLERLF